MRKLTTILTAMLLLATASAQCNQPSTKGTDFWVAYLWNNGEAGTVALKLRAVSDQNATITVTNPSTGWSTAQSLTSPAYSNIAHAEITIPSAQGLNTSPSTVTNYGIHVTSTADISLFAENNRLASGDAALVLPTARLGTRYIVQDYPNSTSAESAGFSGCNLVLLATEDSTVLTMMLPCTTQPSTVPAGNTLTVTLNQGQTYMLVTPTPSQFTGMEITSNGKPFALFQGNRITAVLNGNYTSGDHIYEQALPVDAWGNEFVAISTSGRTWGDMVRITAADQFCPVMVDGTLEVTLAPHSSFDYHLDGGTAKLIQTTAPASATLVMASSTWNAQPGDVSSVTLTPLSAGVCEAIFSLWPTERCNSYYVAIATTESSTAGMTLDGNSIASNFSSLGGTYRYALINVGVGEHVISCTEGTFSAYAYGMGNVESYAFPLGRTFANYTHDTIDIIDTLCQGQSYDTMGVHLPSHITDNLGDTLVHRDITIGSVMTHLRLHLTVMPTWSGEIHDTLAPGDTLWVGDTALTLPGVHIVTLATTYGCDSTFIVHLEMLSDTLHLYDTVCQHQPYSGYGFTLDNPGRDTLLVRDTVENGIPHHYRLHLTVLPSARSDVYQYIILGDTLFYADTFFTTEGTYQFTYTAANGCDSVVVLHLGYEDVGIASDKDGVCPGEEVTITATGTHTYHWSSSPYDPELDLQQGRNPITVHPTVTTVYHLLDAAGNLVASFTVGTAPAPTLCVEYNHRELDFDNPVLLFTDCSEGRHHTVWTFDDGQTFTGSKLRRQFRHPLPDSVIVTMTSCNQYDCCADTTFGLPMRIRSVWFPNIFTPDGESNNLFGCYTSFDVAEFRMVIYNRWGIELWSTEDINTPWDGRRHDGTPCPQGAYVYRYWITSPDGTFKSAIGTVTLIR